MLGVAGHAGHGRRHHGDVGIGAVSTTEIANACEQMTTSAASPRSI
jgi:hypothetical protein